MPSNTPKNARADLQATPYEPDEHGGMHVPTMAFQPSKAMLEQLASLATAIAIDRWAHPVAPEGLLTRARWQAATLAGLRDWMNAGGFSGEPGRPASSRDTGQASAPTSGTGPMSPAATEG
jgi:hypothetical protein